MEYEIVKIENLSGDKTTFYSILIPDENKTLFDIFIEENKSDFNIEVKDILKRLTLIANKTGARDNFFKLNEGTIGDGVSALYDNPNSNLRLYCIKYGDGIILLGGGGFKPKSIRSLQENPKLKNENYLLRAISKLITQKMRDKDLLFSKDYKEFEGDFNLEIDI